VKASEREATAKAAYHHGDLRPSLIAATRRLIDERGEDRFTLADACRAAGVSTAAPYRHFHDKDALLNDVVAEGFIDLTQRMRAAAAHHPVGSQARILEIGQAYLAFGLGEPALFRMMFAQTTSRSSSESANARGRECFEVLVEEVVAYCRANEVDGDADLVAVQLWTVVHGATSLAGGPAFGQVAPTIDVRRLLASATDRLLFSLPQRPTGAPRARR
jgi:AcrR family transcriptional regulator